MKGMKHLKEKIKDFYHEGHEVHEEKTRHFFTLRVLRVLRGKLLKEILIKSKIYEKIEKPKKVGFLK